MARPRLRPLAALAALVSLGAGGDAVADGLTGGGTSPAPVATHPDITAEDVRARVEFLASDALAGRMSLEPGAVKASQYVADEFSRLGLEPVGEGGTCFQPFTIPMPRLGEANLLHLDLDGKGQDFAVEKDWNPFAISSPKPAEGDVVFAGYGIRAEERKDPYDDFAGIDVKGKVVLVLRREPPWGKAATPHATFLAKLAAASEAGASALLVVNDPRTTAGEPDVLFPWSASLGPAPGSGKIPMAFVSRATADRILAPCGKTLADLQKAIDDAKDGAKPSSVPLPGAHVRIRTTVEKHPEPARNVAALLRGSDPTLSKEVVVLGAHFDHVGRGAFGSNGKPSDVGRIHPGADDNASGTAVLLEVAEALASAKERPKRSVLFLAFSGEEMGLLGSLYYCAHPLEPLDEAVTMVNLDMVGRLDESKGLEVGGVGTGEGLQDLVDTAAKPYSLPLTWDPQGVAPTDSTSFFQRHVPVLWFFTGLHADYHTPRDTADRIEAKGAQRIGALTRDVVRLLADRDARVRYTEPPKRPGKAALQLMPGVGAEGEGVLVESVAEGGAAAAGGVLEGDVITALDAVLVRSTSDLMRALGARKPGDEVLVKVLRKGEEKALKVTLGSR